MDASELKKIIAQKNTEREYDTFCDAKSIIDEIVELSEKKTQLQKKLDKDLKDIDGEITELRKKLKELAVYVIDPTEVLGSDPVA